MSRKRFGPEQIVATLCDAKVSFWLRLLKNYFEG